MRIVLLLFTVLLASAQEPDYEKRVDALFASIDRNAPGCAVGIAREGRTVLAKGYGMASLEHAVPLSPASSFYMASVSKQFMAFAILLLAEEGKLKLDDPVRQYIPELPAYGDGITVRQLLHHTSGLRDYLTLGALSGYSPDHVWTDRAARRVIARQKALNFEPGAEFLYSNSGYVMLSWIAEKAAGKRLNEWSQEKIFGPLGMTATRWQQDHMNPVPNRATGHVRQNGAWRIANSMLDVVGDGGLYSTVEDMLKWNANFESRRVGAAALEQMQTPGKLRSGAPVESGYGMGLAKGTYRGLTTVSHGGGLQGYRTFFQRYPEQKFASVILCNNATLNPGRLAEQVAEVWLSEQMQAPKPAPAKPQPESSKLAPLSDQEKEGFAGEYFSEELSVVARVEREGDRLRFSVGDLPASTLMQAPDGRVSIGETGAFVRPKRDAGGRVSSFSVDAGRVRGIEFVRR